MDVDGFWAMIERSAQETGTRAESKFPFLTYHAEPDGAEWDFEDEAEFIRRLPRIARHCGITR
ncbi:hypothetical protein AB0C18_13485 [Nonomuraea muscovyensis]|uniref:hypothetical protein n=1 Tax=Nonomuraea muscovyensis TaxID=1124761 RepID=UPI00340B8214